MVENQAATRVYSRRCCSCARGCVATKARPLLGDPDVLGVAGGGIAIRIGRSGCASERWEGEMTGTIGNHATRGPAFHAAGLGRDGIGCRRLAAMARSGLERNRARRRPASLERSRAHQMESGDSRPWLLFAG